MVYGMPWCRMGAYLVGMWAGYFIYKRKDAGLKLTNVSRKLISTDVFLSKIHKDR